MNVSRLLHELETGPMNGIADSLIFVEEDIVDLAELLEIIKKDIPECEDVFADLVMEGVIPQAEQKEVLLKFLSRRDDVMSQMIAKKLGE